MDIVKAKIQESQKVISEDGFSICADIAGAGKGTSDGIVLMDKDKAVYIPLDAWKDLMAVLDGVVSLCDALNNIESVVVGAVTTGSATTQTATKAGSGAAQIKQAASQIKSDMNKLKEKLK